MNTICAMRGRNPDNPNSRAAGVYTQQRLKLNETGCSNTITTVQKDNLVLDQIEINQATKDGIIECNVPGLANLQYPKSKTRRGRVIDNGKQSPTLTTQNVPELIEMGDEDFWNFVYEKDGEEYLIRVRKLIPLECWRLMDFSDKDFKAAESVNSNSQLYKQAGNSIVRSVLMAIFSQLGIKGVPKWNELSQEERIKLLEKRS